MTIISYNKTKDSMCEGQVTSHEANGIEGCHIGYNKLLQQS